MKRRSLTRNISVLLVAAILLTLTVFLGGCGGQEGETSSNSAQNTTTTAAANESATGEKASEQETSAAPAEPKDIFASIPEKIAGSTVNVLFWYDPASNDEGAVIEDFTAKTGIKVNVITTPYADFMTKLAAMVATGDAPDVARMRTYAPSRLKTMQPVSTANFDFTDPAWDQELMKQFTFNGECYGVNLVNTPFFSPSVCYYNKATFEENGITDPYELWEKGEWNWDTFRQVCKEFASLDKEYFGATMAPLPSTAATLGKDFFKFDGEKYVNTIDDPELQEGWKLLLEMVKERSVSMDTWQTEQFNAGKIGIFIGDSSMLQKKNDNFKKFKLKKELEVVPVPGHKGREYYQPIMEHIAYGIPNGAKNPEAAPYFLRFFLDFDNYDKNNYLFSENALKVFTEMQKVKKSLPVMAGDIITVDSGFSAGEIEYRLIRTDPLQISTSLEEFRNIVDDAVAKANEAIKTLPK